MYCYHHPDRQATGACVECNQMVCPECKVEFGGRIYCNACIEKKIAGGIKAGSTPTSTYFDNTSGMGGKVAVPPGLGDWNWGAFLLTWIWGIGNNVWWSFLVFVPYLGFLVMPWVLAFRGNEWAWQSRRWTDIDHFKSTQRTWAIWGLAFTAALTILLVAAMVIVTLALLWALQQYASSF